VQDMALARDNDRAGIWSRVQELPADVNRIVTIRVVASSTHAETTPTCLFILSAPTYLLSGYRGLAYAATKQKVAASDARASHKCAILGHC
jgi:hypothetical protein